MYGSSVATSCLRYRVELKLMVGRIFSISLTSFNLAAWLISRQYAPCFFVRCVHLSKSPCPVLFYKIVWATSCWILGVLMHKYECEPWGTWQKGDEIEVKLWTGCPTFLELVTALPEGHEKDPIEDSADLSFKASFYGDEKTIAFLFHQNKAKHVDFAGKLVNHGLCLTLT